MNNSLVRQRGRILHFYRRTPEYTLRGIVVVYILSDQDMGISYNDIVPDYPVTVMVKVSAAPTSCSDCSLVRGQQYPFSGPGPERNDEY